MRIVHRNWKLIPRFSKYKDLYGEAQKRIIVLPFTKSYHMVLKLKTMWQYEKNKQKTEPVTDPLYMEI